MKQRPFWLARIRELWTAKSIVWLSGVRRIGKTTLSRQLPGARCLNCDLPSVQRELSDPEFFLSRQDRDRVLVLDEVHRVEDPSLLLKIAADEFPELRILATGSSTLQATQKFRDTLTGRKRSLHLLPVLWQECAPHFDVRDFDRRLIHGGFPEMLLSSSLDQAFFEDWMDSFFARDIQELFGVRNRTGFLSILKLVCLRNGGELDISDLAKETGLSRPTVMSYLDSLEIAHAITRLTPYHAGGHGEIVRRPRVFASDTGLIAHVKGWERIREDDRGHLWKNLVLDELRARYPMRGLHYWRSKSQHEVDFVIEREADRVDAVEARINPKALDARSLAAFRKLHPTGTNHLVCPYVAKPYEFREAGLAMRVSAPADV